MHLSPITCVVVLLLLTYFLLLLPLFVGILCLALVLLFSTLCQSSFVIILMERERERAGCFALSVFLVSCDSQCSVALPGSPVGWSAVCDCGIS